VNLTSACQAPVFEHRAPLVEAFESALLVLYIWVFFTDVVHAVVLYIWVFFTDVVHAVWAGLHSFHGTRTCQPSTLLTVSMLVAGDLVIMHASSR
jgi:hypothetical protein